MNCLTLILESFGSFKTSITVNQSKRCNIAEDLNLQELKATFTYLRVPCVWEGALPAAKGLPFISKVRIVRSTVSVPSRCLLSWRQSSKRFVLWVCALQLPSILFHPQCTQGISVQCVSYLLNFSTLYDKRLQPSTLIYRVFNS